MKHAYLEIAYSILQGQTFVSENQFLLMWVALASSLKRYDSEYTLIQ